MEERSGNDKWESRAASSRIRHRGRHENRISPGAALAVLLVALSTPAWADEPDLPDPLMTPGAVDPAATHDVVCNGTTRARRHVTAAMKAEVLAGYNIRLADRSYYEIDHLIPLAIGGAKVVTNLWPQPWAEADQKDVLEVELQRRVCLGLLTQAEAQREIAENWTAAYQRYVGGPLVVAPDPSPVATSTPTPALKPTVKARLKAEAWRLARRWILGTERPYTRAPIGRLAEHW